jgi:hypothetical protein
MKEACFIISRDKDKIDRELVLHYLQNTWWGRTYTSEGLERAIDYSICFSLFDPSLRQIGFSRVVTDALVVGYITDTFIVESHSNKGLGTRLFKYIFSQEDLRNVRRWLLYSDGAEEFFETLGFSKLLPSSIQHYREMITRPF